MIPPNPPDLYSDLFTLLPFRPRTRRERLAARIADFERDVLLELLSPAELAVTLATIVASVGLVLLVAAIVYATFYGIATP